MTWSPCKITVLKTMFNQDLAEQYRRQDIHRGPCPFFTEGQEFVVELVGVKPEGFDCDWAWNDIEKIVTPIQIESASKTTARPSAKP